LEQPGYFKTLDGSPLYGVYHTPESGQNERALPVVICPPIFEERKSAYGPLRRLAMKLASAGHAVMRFDYRGSGESGGDPATRRWQHLREDVAVARKTLAKLAGKRDSALLGLRLGGTLALQETQRVGGEAVIALAPIVKGSAQVRLWKMRSKIRAELTSGEAAKTVSSPNDAAQTFDFDGYEVHSGFFDDVAAIDLPKDLAALSCPARVIQISHRAELAPETTQLIQTLGSRSSAHALRMEAFWDKLDDVDTGPLEDLVAKSFSEF
jgi:pimeloyl-ACP methyl ester carboxylesterase